MNENMMDNIDQQLENLRPPFKEGSKEKAKASVLARINNTEKKVISINRRRQLLFAAAAIALFIALPLSLIIFGEKTIAPTSGQVSLPDGSTITLSDNSSASFNQLTWSFDRSIELDGEGYFEVEQGSEFTVNTDLGQVKVLGTKFTVWENDDELVVYCQEGKVNASGEILSKDQYAIISLSGTNRGTWNSSSRFLSHNVKEMKFEETPLPLVVETIEARFEQRIELNCCSDSRFTGELITDEIGSTIKILCEALDLESSTDDSGVIILDR